MERPGDASTSMVVAFPVVFVEVSHYPMGLGGIFLLGNTSGPNAPTSKSSDHPQAIEQQRSKLATPSVRLRLEYHGGQGHLGLNLDTVEKTLLAKDGG